MCVNELLKNNQTINQLFDFYEEELYKNTEENKEFINKISELEKIFYESLNDEQKKKFEEIIDLHALNEAVTDKNIFKFGFKLAVNLMFGQ